MLMRKLAVLTICGLALAGTSACKGSKSGGGKTSIKKLHETGLRAALPEGANVGKALMGDGAMVTSGSTGAVTIAKAKQGSPDTIEKMKKEIEMYSPKNIKTETLADGWLLTFENKGSMGANYWVKVYRKIGGTAWLCDTTGSQKEQQAGAVALCKSLTQ